MDNTPKLLPGAYYGNQPHKRSVSGIFLSESHHLSKQYVPSHSHTNAHFYLVLKGFSKEYAASGARSCQPGMLVYHPPEEVHSNKWLTNGLCFCIEFFNDRYQQHKEVLDAIDSTHTFAQGRPSILVNRLYKEFHMGDSASLLAIEGITLELLAELSRKESRSIVKETPEWLLQAKEAIHDQVLQPLTLADLASLAQVHPSHFAKIFRQHFNCSPGEYIRKLRIEWACKQLISSSSSVGEIALKSGFYDQSHFNRVFKNYMSMTPGQYKKLFQ